MLCIIHNVSQREINIFRPGNDSSPSLELHMSVPVRRESEMNVARHNFDRVLAPVVFLRSQQQVGRETLRVAFDLKETQHRGVQRNLIVRKQTLIAGKLNWC